MEPNDNHAAQNVFALDNDLCCLFGESPMPINLKTTPNTKPEPITIKLYNCDNTIELDHVEPLFDGLNVKCKQVMFTAQNLAAPLDLLSHQQSSDYIVVMAQHANEPRLSFNVPGSGIGLGKLFNKLQNHSHNHILVVILNDTSVQYTDNGPLLSAAIFNKVLNQFTEQQLNGEHGLVLSWNNNPTQAHKNAIKAYIEHFPHQGHCIIPDINFGMHPTSAIARVDNTQINKHLWWEVEVVDGKILKWKDNPPLPGRDISNNEFIFLQNQLQTECMNGVVKICTAGGVIKEMRVPRKNPCWIM